MQAEYVDHMGTDLTVVNAARVSFNKISTDLDGRDRRLIKYLAAHGHWTPFAHPQITFRITAPIFVARQAFKHKVGFVENEISRRYVDDPPEFYLPEKWRTAPENAKQGSGEGFVETIHYLAQDDTETNISMDLKQVVEWQYDRSRRIYEAMIEAGVAPEQARMILPQAMYTSWHWTASLAAWARAYKQRTKPDAQEEIRYLFSQIDPKMRELYPCSWSALVDE